MPEQGRYEKLPRAESIEKLIEYLNGNRAVSYVKQESKEIIQVERVKHSPLKVFMTNIYIVGLADVHEILARASELDAIVTMSAWNGYTSEAKYSCKKKGIGLIRFKELLGAVHFGGEQYLNYIPPSEREKRGQLGGKG